MPATPASFDRDVLIYDGQCRICSGTARRIKAWDRLARLEILPSQDPTVSERFPTIPARAFSESIQVIAPDGSRWQGAAAVERVIDLLPGGRWLTWVFDLPGTRPAAERWYRWFARNRHRLGCGDRLGRDRQGYGSRRWWGR
jgi:predicted DCC family thiol-disulfide oxidoreductase YuxK